MWFPTTNSIQFAVEEGDARVARYVPEVNEMGPDKESAAWAFFLNPPFNLRLVEGPRSVYFLAIRLPLNLRLGPDLRPPPFAALYRRVALRYDNHTCCKWVGSSPARASALILSVGQGTILYSSEHWSSSVDEPRE